MKTRTLILLSFILTTVLLAAASFFTFSFYFGIYKATHVLDVEVQGFSVTILNQTHARTMTKLTLENPSEYEFEVIYVEERLTSGSWGGEYILVERIWFPNPKPLEPASNLSVTISSYVFREKINPTEQVFAVIRTYLRGPLIGEFMFTSYEMLSE